MNIFITIFIHHRKRGDSLIHEDAECGVERRISVNHCDVVKRPDVQLLQRLRQKRRFGDFRYLGEKIFNIKTGTLCFEKESTKF